MLCHDSGLNLTLNCGMMPSLKSEQESPGFSSLLGILRLSLRVLDFEHLMPVEVVNGASRLSSGRGWRKYFHQMGF